MSRAQREKGKRCDCGCGEAAPIAPHTDRRRGWVRGEPLRFVRGHGSRKSLESLHTPVDGGHATPCWRWLGGKNEGGYGRTKHNGRMAPAHRATYETHVGPVPEGLELDHLCFNPWCVNPAHLEPVTRTENVRRRRCAKLTEDDVRAIRAEQVRLLAEANAASPRRDGRPRTRTPQGARHAIAEQYGVSSELIKQIWSGRIWAL